MKSDVDEVALQGIEFWSTVCDEEVDLAIDAVESAEKGLPPAVCSKHYAKGALQYLVPILVEVLPKLEENDDEDEWNPAKAAGELLTLALSACGLLLASLPLLLLLLCRCLPDAARAVL